MSEERFRTMVESSSEGMCTVDADDRLVFLNPRMAEMLAVGMQELTGGPVADLVNAADRAGLALALDACRAGRQDRRELSLARQGLPDLPVILSTRALMRVDGSSAGALMVVTDISDRVAAELRRDLERSQLHDTQRLEGISRLAGGIAHEFNNLMAVILNYAGFIDAELGDRPDLRSDLREITTAATRSADLTRQLLIFSRQDVAVLERLDLRDIIAEAEALLRSALPAGVVVSVTTPTEPCVILADRHQVRQVLLNLAINSGEAMPSGGRLTIELDSLAADDESRPWVKLRVGDTGRGMSEEVAARAFEPFYTTETDARGSGLGLASVYGIVADHHGRVDIDSREGVGTTVTVHLPAADPAEMPANEAVNPPSGALVLLVEDEPAVRNLASRLLIAAGFSVIACGDPTAALARPELAAGAVEVLLTDLLLPGMTGEELARRVRQRLPATGVVFMSGYTDDSTIRAAIQGASVVFVEKPFTGAELVGGVHRALARGHQSRNTGSEGAS
jgi:two-component system cell cycle sensor histidine kinase/response regulator CckA